MIKLKKLLKEEDRVLITRRTPEERQKNYIIVIQKKIQQYIKDGSKGTLDLSNTPITLLPDNLTKVGGDLDLRNTPITSLPNSLEVGRDLDLRNISITSLPNNLTIKGGLYLDNTPIISLPNNLTVGGDLYLRNTPIGKKYTEEQIKQMVPGVKGEILI